ncbi:MAG TPA: YegS/Rv2252/BmrU family lipid kinase [Longimicrobiales bacterium]|nr:YegS/Rv2252/BmrU family lipid kinase [Longimicrobiales bacterium]
MRIGLIIRPREGMEGLEELRGEVERLRAAGHAVRPRLTFETGDAVRFARSTARAGADLVVAVGGDGTLNEVVNGLMREDWGGRVGLVPAGTANDFAAGMEIPFPFREALRVAVGGHPIPVDVARVNDRYFINVSTGGFGATATEEAPSESKRLLGPWAYVITGVRKFADLRPANARFLSENREVYNGPVMLFAVGNARRTGGGSMLTPRAEFGDGKLDVLIVPGMPRMDFLALLPDLRSGTHVDHPDVHYFQTPRLLVESEEPLSVNADGEPQRGRRFAYDLSDRTLTFMVPGA